MTTRKPSPTALATRSLRIAMQKTDPEDRRAALRQHFQQFPPVMGGRHSCPV